MSERVQKYRCRICRLERATELFKPFEILDKDNSSEINN
jgi:hypothetical protein